MQSNNIELLIRVAGAALREGGTARAIGVSGGRIVSVSPDPAGLDQFVGPETRVIDAPNATALPSFDDTHSHLLYAALGIFDAPVHTARTIPEMVGILRTRAEITPAGDWIVSTTNWQELNLEEERLPTRQELDAASSKHPILLRRGGHNAVANSLALELAGLERDTPDPEGGLLGRDNSGDLTGYLMDTAMLPVERLLPHPDPQTLVAGIEEASRQYAATGLGTVRDALVSEPGLWLFKQARDEGRLNVRVRALADAFRVHTVGEVAEVLDWMKAWDSDDDWLKLIGVKLGMDGGLEAAATSEPYSNDPENFGLLMWDHDAFVESVLLILDHGFSVGTHAFGDLAIQAVLDGYEAVLAQRPDVDPRRLVVEHAGMCTKRQREGIAALGVPVTIQQPLLHDAAKVALRAWGQERTESIFPAKSWLNAGVLISGGSDYPVGPFGAMQSVWGLSTRETTVGVLGPEERISPAEAIRIHTQDAARTLREEEDRGALFEGALADITLWDLDPSQAEPEALHGLEPLLNVVGGRVVFSRLG